MTAAEWLSCADPEQLLAFLHAEGKATPTLLRRFAVACCELVWPSFKDPRCRAAFAFAQQMAAGEVDDEDLDLIEEGVGDAWGEAWGSENTQDQWTAEAAGVLHITHADPWVAAVQTARYAAAFWPDATWRALVEANDNPWEPIAQPESNSPAWQERQTQVALLRDLTGNPFQ